MHEYGKIARWGKDRDHKHMLGRLVEVQEKIDGSQFSFWRDPDTGRPVYKTRNRVLGEPGTRGQFEATCAHLDRCAEALYGEAGWLPYGVVFRGEAMKGPRMNVLEYGRAPRGNLVLWGIEDAGDGHPPGASLEAYAAHLGVEPVPVLARFVLENPQDLKDLVEGESALGGRREGIVVKCRHESLGELRAKLVASSFSEVAKVPKRARRDDPFGEVAAARVMTRARAEKAVQRLRDERGGEEPTLRDMSALIRSASLDALEEEGSTLRLMLWEREEKGVRKALGAAAADHLREILS